MHINSFLPTTGLQCHLIALILIIISICFIHDITKVIRSARHQPIMCLGPICVSASPLYIINGPLIPGVSRKVNNQYNTAIMINGRRIGGSLPRNPEQLQQKVQMKTYNNYRSILLLKGYAERSTSNKAYIVYIYIPICVLEQKPAVDGSRLLLLVPLASILQEIKN